MNIINSIKAFFRVMFGMPTADDLLRKSIGDPGWTEGKMAVKSDLLWMAKNGETSISFRKFYDNAKYEYVKRNILYLESLGYSVVETDSDPNSNAYSVSWRSPGVKEVK